MSEPDVPIPVAEINEKRRLSAIWIVPIVAVLIGAWLVYKSVSEQGPAFTITFHTAEGLEAGKTKIKYRELELGVIEELELSGDLTKVKATARIAPQYEKFLTEETRFWVVRARVSAGNVTGLSTLLGGAYIGIDPVQRGSKTDKFVGLEEMPLVTSQEQGTRYVLEAKSMGSVEVGTPVMYHQMRVGEVTRTRLKPDGEGVEIIVFVRQPFDGRVRTSSRWWNTSGFDATINQNGLRIETESFLSMVIGGIAFDNPPDSQGVGAPPEAVYPLYRNKAATESPEYVVRERFMAYFQGSVKGLEKGSVVEFRGIQVGEVAEVRMEYEPLTGEVFIPVVIEIQPERINLRGALSDLAPTAVEQARLLVERGLRARLESGNLLTGALVVSLDFHPLAEPAVLKVGGNYPEIPTLPKQLDEIAGNVRKLVDKLDHIPVERLGKEIAGAISAMRGTLEQTEAAGKQANRDVLPGVTATLEAARDTLKTVQLTLASAEKVAQAAGKMVAPSSSMNTELLRMMNEMTDTMRSVRLLVEQLDRSPESLLMGRKEVK